jgi:RNA polymerase sigma factor (sigma-70 family)
LRVSVGERRTEPDDDIVDLVPVVRRVVASRIRDPHLVEDLVQETLARVVASRDRVEGTELAPYAVVTARNLIASHAERSDRARRNAHLLVDVDLSERPGDGLLRQEDRSAVQVALTHVSDDERDLLVAHEVQGESTASIAQRRGSTPGAVAAQLARTRAKLRVEYLLIHEGVDPPTEQCRPVLRALSAGDRRRARELDAPGHLLGCASCSRLNAALNGQRATEPTEGAVRVAIGRDADVVEARQKGREVAGPVGFSATDCTIIATAISEVARNIVKFASRGEVVIEVVQADDRDGLRVVARDAGPGIPDVASALEDGYSTYQGLGLGLPGCRRLMDDFEIDSKLGEGTTVTMTKWNWRTAGTAPAKRRQEGNA